MVGIAIEFEFGARRPLRLRRTDNSNSAGHKCKCNCGCLPSRPITLQSFHHFHSCFIYGLLMFLSDRTKKNTKQKNGKLVNSAVGLFCKLVSWFSFLVCCFLLALVLLQLLCMYILFFTSFFGSEKRWFVGFFLEFLILDICVYIQLWLDLKYIFFNCISVYVFDAVFEMLLCFQSKDDLGRRIVWEEDSSQRDDEARSHLKTSLFTG